MQKRDQKPLVVLISANAKVREWISRCCVSKKYDYLEFRNGASFMAVSVKTGIDVAIIDARLEDNSEIKLAAMIKEKDKNTRIIIITDKPSETCEREARSLGIIYFAIWPEDRDYLKEVFLAAVISRHREQFWLRRQVSCSINQRACL